MNFSSQLFPRFSSQSRCFPRPSFRLAAAATTLGLSAFAESPPADATSHTLDRYVVTATRTPIEIENAPGSLSLVTREQIDLRPASRIGDLLRSQPGIYTSNNVTGQGMPSAQSGRFTLRGIPGSARTLVLLDNLPLNDPYLGNVNWASLFMDEIQRVEVAPGGGSALYGGNAFAGVIHAITREPTTREIFLRGRLQRDSAQQNEGSLLYRDLWTKRLGVSIGYNRIESFGYSDEMDLVKTASTGVVPSTPTPGAVATLTPTGTPAWIVGHLSPRPWSSENAQAKLFYSFDSGAKLRLGLLHFQSDISFGAPESFLSDTNGQPLLSGTFNLGGQRVVLVEREFLNPPAHDRFLRAFAFFEQPLSADLQLNTGLSYSERDRTANNLGTSATLLGGSGTLTDSPTSTYDFYTQLVGRLGQHQRWIIGTQFNRGETPRASWTLADWRDASSRLVLTDTAFGQTDNLSLYAQDEITFNPRFSLFVGARYDWFRTEGVETIYAIPAPPARTEFAPRTFGQFSPRLAAVYKPWRDATARLSVGRAFRAPTLFDFYVVSRRGTTTTLSNPQLNPESAWNYDLSFQQNLPSLGTELTVTGFANELSDLIYTKTLSATLRQAINAGEAWSRGFEIKLRQRLVTGISAQLAYTYTRTRIVSNDADPTSVGKELVNAPRNLLTFLIEGRHRRWFGNLSYHYVDDSFDTAANTELLFNRYSTFSSYGIVNAQLGYALNPHAELIVSGENLLDREYFQFTREPGRVLSFSTRLKF